MHRSRLSTLIIDVPGAERSAAVQFWAAALGVALGEPDPQEPEFTSLGSPLPGLSAAVQAIDGAARYHLDFETDDVRAETDRLTAGGAVQVGRWLDCRILRAPGGHLLCVMPQYSEQDVFERHAMVWP